MTPRVKLNAIGNYSELRRWRRAAAREKNGSHHGENIKMSIKMKTIFFVEKALDVEEVTMEWKRGNGIATVHCSAKLRPRQIFRFSHNGMLPFSFQLVGFGRHHLEWSSRINFLFCILVQICWSLTTKLMPRLALQKTPLGSTTALASGPLCARHFRSSLFLV